MVAEGRCHIKVMEKKPRKLSINSYVIKTFSAEPKQFKKQISNGIFKNSEKGLR